MSNHFCDQGRQCNGKIQKNNIHYTHTRLTALCPGLPRWAGTRKVKPILISLKQETVSGSGISWAICKSAPRSRQTTTPAPHHSVFYRPDALPATQPTASKHWRYKITYTICTLFLYFSFAAYTVQKTTYVIYVCSSFSLGFSWITMSDS